MSFDPSSYEEFNTLDKSLHIFALELKKIVLNTTTYHERVHFKDGVLTRVRRNRMVVRTECERSFSFIFIEVSICFIDQFGKHSQQCSENGDDHLEEVDEGWPPQVGQSLLKHGSVLLQSESQASVASLLRSCKENREHFCINAVRNTYIYDKITGYIKG